jgi:GT2 family glycosyltransferase
MIPTPDSVARHVEFHRQHPNAIVTGNTPQDMHMPIGDFNRYRIALSEKWTKHFPDHVFKFGSDNFFMTAANCSIPLTVFTMLGGFDEKFRDAEDQELAIRASKANVGLYFDKQNIAWHHETVSCRAYILRLRQYASAHDQLEQKYGSESYRSEKAVEHSRQKQWIYSFLARPFLVRIIDSYTVFKIVPRRWRYRLYDAVTHALSQVHPEVRI